MDEAAEAVDSYSFNGYTFVEALRQGSKNKNTTITHVDSSIVRVSENHRLGHLAMLSAVGMEIYPGRTIALEGILNIDFGGFLAIHHFNQRNNAVVPNLSAMLEGCDVYLTLKIYDTQFSRQLTGQHLTDILTTSSSDSNEQPEPTGFIGTTSSATSATSGTVTSALKIPQVSCCATSRSLTPELEPYFARTIPSNQADARAVVAYLADHLGVTHMGVLYGDNEYGRDFSRDVQQYAFQFGIKSTHAAFTYDDQGSADTALSQLAEQQVRYIFSIASPSQITDAFLFEQAEKHGLVGKGYTWLFSENFADFTTDDRVFNATSQTSVIKALNGSGVVLLSVPEHEGYNQEARNFQTDSDLQDFYVQSHDDQSVGLLQGVNFTEWNYGSSFYGQLNYDAAMALAISTCTPKGNDFPTGSDLLDNLMNNIDFQGASGHVKIDKETGARDYHRVSYAVFNLIADTEPDEEGMIHIQARSTSMVDLVSGSVTSLEEPFMYASGTLEIPPSLPPLQETKQLIEPGALIFGYVMCAVLVLFSLAWLVWTLYYRDKRVVKSAQPMFLCMLCFGSLLMVCAIIPMSFQDGGSTSQTGLNVACMAVPYLLSIGFTTCFATLYSKLRRIKLLMKAARNFKRVRILPQDVMIPLASLLTVNVGLLVAWTVVAPLEWSRIPVEDSVDRFGRPTETSGSCRATDQSGATAFIASLVCINLISLALSLYQSFKCRNLPIDYNETEYIALSTWGLFEATLLGLPVLWLASENETAQYTVKVLLIAAFSLSVVLPMFLPKALRRLKRRTTEQTRFVSSRFSEAFSSDGGSGHGGSGHHRQLSGGAGRYSHSRGGGRSSDDLRFSGSHHSGSHHSGNSRGLPPKEFKHKNSGISVVSSHSSTGSASEFA